MDTKTNAKAGYDAAIKLIDKEARSIWTFFGAMVAVNAILITLTAASHSPLLKLNEKVPALPALLGILGIIVCVIWFLLTHRTRGFYDYYMACAREFESVAFGEDVKLIRNGKLISDGKPVVMIDGSSFSLDSFGKFITAKALIYFVILLFLAIYFYIGVFV